MNKKILISFILISLTLISCSEDKKNVKPLNKFNPQNEIEQSIENLQASILFEQAEKEYEKRNYRTSINLLNTALTFEKNPIIYNELGTVSYTIKEFEEAILYHKKGIKADSLYYPNYVNQAKVFAKIGDFDNAEKLLKRTIKKCDSEFWTSCANLYLAVLYFNDDQCLLAKEFILKAESLKNESALKREFKMVQTKIKEYCS